MSAAREQRMLHAVTFASETLLRAHDWRERVDPVLAQLGEATEMSRVYLFRNRVQDGRVLTSQLHEWVAPGVAPQLGNPELTDFPMAEGGYGRWVEVLGAGGVIAGRIEEFPPEEQEFLAAQGIRALAVAPVHVADCWWGFLGFDDCAAGRTWSREEQEILATTARILGAAIERTESEEQEAARAQAEQQENAEKLRAIFTGAPIGIALVDASGALVTVNAAIEELFGRSAAELREVGVAGVSHPDDLQRDFELFQELVAGKRQSYRIEKRYIHKSGELRWGRLSLSRIDLPGGVHAVAMVEDITERTLAEQRLRESEERFRILAERVREVFYVAEADPPRIAYVSPGYEDVWQQSCDSLYANPRTFLDAIHPDDRPRVIASLERQQRGEETVEEYRVLRPDGSMRWIRDRAYPVEEGGRLRVVGLAEDITDQKLADEQIGRTQERYELIARATNDVIWDWDLRTDRLEWNEAISVTFGHDLQSIPQHVDWWYEHVHPEDRERVVGGIHAAIEAGASSWTDEYRFARADGTYATVLDRGYIARDRDGRPVRMIGAMLDLTERKKAEADLRARDLRYRSLVESSTQIVWTTNARGEIEDMPVWRAITGQTLEEVRGAGWLNAIHPEDRERTRETWERAYHSRTIYDAEYRIRLRDGSYRWFAARGIPVIDEDGTLREWVGTCGDIDERKRAESALTFLADASAVLATSLDLETTLRRIAALAVPRLADWCVVDMRTEGGYERLAAEHRHPDKRSLARELWERYPPRPDRRDVVAEVLQSGEPVLLHSVSDDVLEASAHDAEHLHILRTLGLRSAMTVPLTVGGGAPIGAITFVTAESGRAYTAGDLAVADDLARRAALAIENARLYRAAQEANRAKDEFLATLSHELRTPLTAILGWSRILADDPGERELLVQGLETIHRSAVAQARLIDDVLDVSRIISGKLRLEMQGVDLPAVVNASAEAVAPAAQAKDILLRVTHEAPGLVVFADANRLQQVVWNLLANAIKFTPPGGRVEARTHAGTDVAVITVSDTGQGIAPEFLPHVFEPFRQAESSTTRVHGGLGLGLAIVRYLVESHGGRVSAFSEGAGRGAQFTIELPLRQPADRFPAEEPSGWSAPRAATAGESYGVLAGVRVLFVDDQQDTREFAAFALHRAGAAVMTAGSVDEAFSLFRSQPFDVVVSDIAMPDRDGYDLIAAIRNELRSGVPAMAVTAFGRPDDVDRARRAGFDACLRKPLEPRELVRAVADLVR